MNPLQSFVDANNRFWKFVSDALGIKPEEPPIISDVPPIHAVDGEIKLGEPQLGEPTYWGKKP